MVSDASCATYLAEKILQQHSQNFQVVVEAYSSSLSTACVHILAMDQRVNGIIALSCPAVFNSKAQSPSKDLHQQFISHVWLFWTFGNLKSFSYLDKFSKPGHLKTSEFCMQSQVTLTKKYKIDFVSCPACGSFYCLVGGCDDPLKIQSAERQHCTTTHQNIHM